MGGGDKEDEIKKKEKGALCFCVLLSVKEEETT
jgi:hypothetical protein